MSTLDEIKMREVLNKVISSIRSKMKRKVRQIYKDETGLFVKSMNGTFKVNIKKSEMEGFVKEIKLDSDKLSFMIKGKLLRNDNLTAEECGLNDASVINVVHSPGVEVIVESVDGQMIMFEVRKDDRIIDIVEKIQNIIKFDPARHTLMYRGSMLDKDDMKIQDLHYVEGGVISVVNKVEDQITIRVSISDNVYATLEVRKSDRLGDVKKNIEETFGIRAHDHDIRFKKEILEDDKTVQHYSITDKCEIDVVPRNRGMQIFAKTLDGKTVTLEVINNDRIMDIKKKIQEKMKLALYDQILLYQGVVLKDEKTVDEYQIVEKSVINVVARLRVTMQIFAKTMEGNIVALEVTKYDTIMDIKKKIQEKMKLALYDQLVLYQGVVLEDEKTVDEYHIVEKSVIKIVATLRGGVVTLNIRTTEGTVTKYALVSCGRIKLLKEDILRMLGLSLTDQIFLYQGQELDDDKNIDDYNFEDENVIEIVSQSSVPLDILIHTSDGRRFTLAITNKDKLIDVKKKIQDELGLLVKDQILRVEGHILRGDSEIMYNSMLNKTGAIHVSVAKKITITIVCDGTESVKVEVLTTDLISDIKKKIQEKIGIPCDEQTLMLGVTTLDGIMTVDQCGIFDGSEIYWKYKVAEQETQGICLVINNVKLSSNLMERDRSEVDVASIKDTFEPMHFEVKVRRDVGEFEMETICDETKEDVQSSHRMLIVFVLGHGARDGFITADGRLYPTGRIMNKFSNLNFPILSGKPKIFYFVCSRGSNEDMGLYVLSVPLNAMMDVFIGYAMCEDYWSLPSPREGSLFVSLMCDVIRSHQEWSVTDIFQEVQSTFSRESINAIPLCQLPYSVNKLTCHACFADSDS